MQILFQKKSLILSIIFFMFSCVIFLFLYKNLMDIQDSSQVAEGRWQVEASQRDNMKSLVNAVKAIESERNLLETHFVRSSDIVPFLDTIEKSAKEVGAIAEVFSVDVAKDNSSLTVGMKASGSFENIYKLITLLENSPFMLEFISVNVQNGSVEDVSNSKTKKINKWLATFQIKLLSFVNQ